MCESVHGVDCNREVELLLDCAAAVLNRQTFRDAAAEIYHACQKIIGATSGYIAVLNEKAPANTILYLDTGFSECKLDSQLSLPLRGMREKVVRSGIAAYENRFRESEWSKLLPEGHIALENVMIVPMSYQDKVVGLLSFGNKPGGFADHDAQLGEAFGNFASIALQHSRTKEKLLESEELYRRLLELSPDAIFIEQDGLFVLSNAAMARLVGEEGPHAVIGRSVLDYIHPDSVVTFLADITDKEVSLPGQSVSQALRADGTVIDVEINRAPFVYNGQPANLVIARDITERKRFEEEMVKSSKLEAVNLLAGGVAHDFNNLLTIILGNLSIAKMYSDKNSDVYRKLLEVESAAGQTKDLTRQLLALSKEPVFDKEVVSVREILIDTVTFALHGTNCTAGFDIPEDLPAVLLDSARFVQVINNLVINAVQAMDEGGRIRVGAEALTLTGDMFAYYGLAPGDYVKITLEDEGVGIPPEIADKIFDPFFTTKTEGSGLGLATSFNIIKKHGGHIAVDSQVGRGTVFIIFLPATSGDVLETADSTVYPGQGRVLLLDDEESIRKTAGEMLGLLGYDTDLAETGEQVLSLYRQALRDCAKYDVVILDKTVRGGMGGLKTISLLRSVDPEVKAVLSSGYATATTLAELEEKGFVGFISKPYRIEELSSVLKEVGSIDKQPDK